MLIINKKTFSIGMAMLIVFTVLFFYIMSPSFGDGRNGLEYADETFNALSKGSAYFIQGEMKKAEAVVGQQIEINVAASDTVEAQTWAKLYTSAGVSVDVSGAELAIKGDLGKILNSTLTDCDAMYNNQGEKISSKYDLDPRVATYGWFKSLTNVSGALDKQENFQQSAAVQSVLKKAVEPAYNFYGIESKKVVDHKETVFFLLAFYLFYTLLYGFAIYYISDGVGITMTKAAKKVEA